MEGQSQLQRTHEYDHHRHQEDPHHHSVMEGEVEGEQKHNQHGEKKSVLTKVKNKAKKIKDKITHAGHAHDDDDYEYDYDEDEETVNRSDLQAAPMVNETAFISGTALPKQTGLNLENPTIPLEDRLAPSAYNDVRNVGVKNNEMYSNVEDDPFPLTMNETSSPDPLQSTIVGLGRDTDRLPTSFESEQRAYVSDPTAKIGPLGGLEKDPHGPGPIPSSNYQSKVADPTGRGGEEADVTPLLKRLDNVQDDDESQRRKNESYTRGGEDFDVTPLSKRLDNLHVNDESERRETESYTTSGEEVDVTPVLKRLDNLHVDDEAERKTESEVTGSPMTDQSNPKSFDAERLESMPQDTIAGKISAATSVISDKAVAAKNAVASKLGYGGSTLDQQEKEVGVEVEVDRPQRAPVMDTVSEYGHKVAKQLAPAYEKVAGAGSAIMSKGQGQGQGRGGEEDGGGDKGVSVQGYLVEKLRPGEEDRELSKVITEAIHETQRSGEGQQQPPVKETVTVEAVAADEKAAAGVVGRVKGAIGSWLGKKGDDGEGLEKEIASKLKE